MLSVNEVLLDDLGLTMMFEDVLIEDWYVEKWLKINDGFVIILEWFSGFVCDSEFISEWQWFSLMGSMFCDMYTGMPQGSRVYMWVCWSKVVYILWYFIDQGFQLV